MNIYKKWQNENISAGTKLFALIIGALIFPISIPVILGILLPNVDKNIGLGSFYFGIGNIITGVVAIITGGCIALWTIYAQIKFASGTPFPMLPTKNLLIFGSFKFCRNPMTLGTIISYTGVAVLVGSYSALFVVIFFTLMLFIYIKLIEEKELELRFGKDYLDYKENTPFILPIQIVKVKRNISK